MEKDNIQNLINIGRQIVREKGTDALTVRKLSEASGYSVGAIYNQFSNMDNYIAVQNLITLQALTEIIAAEPETEDAFDDLNSILQKFVDFVCADKNLWYLLFSFHLTHAK